MDRGESVHMVQILIWREKIQTHRGVQRPHHSDTQYMQRPARMRCQSHTVQLESASELIHRRQEPSIFTLLHCVPSVVWVSTHSLFTFVALAQTAAAALAVAAA